jgi:hypothetical protein
LRSSLHRLSKNGIENKEDRTRVQAIPQNAWFSRICGLLTNVFYGDIISSMIIYGNTQGADTDLIYAGLGQISGRGREILKHIAQSLAWAQNNPGYPLPECIGRQIRRELGTPGACGGDSSGKRGLR